MRPRKGDLFRSEGLVNRPTGGGVATCRYCIPYERDLKIHVCRGLRLEMAELWSVIKHYD